MSDVKSIIGRNDITISTASLQRTAQQLRTKLSRQMEAVKATEEYLALVEGHLRTLLTTK